MKKTIAFLFVLLSAYGLFAQQVDEKAMSAYFKAKGYAQFTQWEEGIAELKKAIKIQPDFLDAHALLGEMYYASKKYDSSIIVLQNIIDQPGIPARSYYCLSESYLKKSEIAKAKQYAQQYLNQPNLQEYFARKAQRTVINGNFAEEAMKHPVPFNPKNLGANINTKSPEYFPYLTPDGSYFLFTRLENNQEDVYYAKKSDTSFIPAQSFGTNINTYENEAAAVMNVSGNLLFLTECNKLDGFGSCDIYFSQNSNGNWSKPMGIGKPVNSGAWEAQPSFSSDSKALYFSSNRKGGFGGRDIWVTYLDSAMHFSEPVNLGNKINTPYDDQCPFIFSDNKTLYFTSDGWPGMGAGDIFMAQLTDTGWTNPKNLGYPINTESDDNGLTVSYDGKTAYLSSNRSNGYGGLDIYSFELPDAVRPPSGTFVKAIIMDKKTKQLLPANYRLINLENKNEVINGIAKNGNFFERINANKNYAVQVEKDGYLFYSQNINLKANTQVKPYQLKIELEPIAVNAKITLDNIFFDFDKFDLKSESFADLENLTGILKKNPGLKIEISGHTDHIGDAKYNLNLSQKRAESVLNYLVQQGISASRLTAKGYGDTQPVAPNDTEENRAQNRRIELKIISLD